MIRALVIGRRRKGRKIGQAIRETQRRLDAAGWTVHTALVVSKRAVRHRAARATVDVVVAVGGDGTVFQVVQALADTPVALGIIPMGTGNLLAGNLRIPHALAEAVDVLVDGARSRIDLGRVTIGAKRELFAVACGIGFDAEVMKSTGTAAKEREGKLAYVASAIRQSQRVHDVAHRITLDGERRTMQAADIFIANFGRLGSALADLEVRPDDGFLDVIVVRASGPLRGLLAGWEALRQREPGRSADGDVYSVRARKIKVECTPRRLVEVDGSVLGRTPIKVSVRPAALTVIVPTT